MELLRSHSSFLYVLPALSWTQVIRWPLDYDIISSIKQCDILHKNRFISRIQNWLLTCRYVPSKWSFHSHFPFRISHVAFIVRYCWLEGWRFQWNWQWHVPFANSSTGNHGSTLFFVVEFVSSHVSWLEITPPPVYLPEPSIRPFPALWHPNRSSPIAVASVIYSMSFHRQLALFAEEFHNLFSLRPGCHAPESKPLQTMLVECGHVACPLLFHKLRCGRIVW